MKSLKHTLNNDHSVTNIELLLVRAYVVFDIAEKLLTLTLSELYDLGHKVGWW